MGEKKKWYIPVLQACFGDLSKMESKYLQMLAGAMAAPCYSKYAREQGVPQEQARLLEVYRKTICDWTASKPGVKERAMELGDKLLYADGKLDKTEVRNWLGRNDKYCSKDYVSLYLEAEEAKRQDLFDCVSKMYGVLLAKLYEGLDDERNACLRAAKELLSQKLPAYLLCDGDDDEQFGRALCALLLWHAAKDMDSADAEEMVCKLLNIERFEESCSTRLMLSMGDVTMTELQFRLICNAVLRSELSFVELEAIYQILWNIHEKTGMIDPNFQSLVEKFTAAAKELGHQMAQNWEDHGDHLKLLSGMCKTCESWIN